MSISTAIARTKIRFRDWIRFHPVVRESYATYRWVKSVTSRRTDEKLANLAVAYRHAHSEWLSRQVDKSLKPWLAPSTAAVWRDRQIGWQMSSWSSRITDQFINKSLVLKEPRGNEKGVFYITFEYNWLRLLDHVNVPELLKEYFLVLQPSWSPPGVQYFWSLARLNVDPVFVGISNTSDLKLYSRFADAVNLAPVPVMACDWILPDLYTPKPAAQREIDILMVAGWGRVKRHWLLFHALRKMRRNVRVVLIGKDMDGRTADDVFREAKIFGVAGQVEIIRDAPMETVIRHQCNSRTSLIFSKREGSCVAVCESLFADTPTGLLRNAHVGSAAYINHQTGQLLTEDGLDRALSRFLDDSPKYRPRYWALAHITCHQSTQKVNAVLKDYSRQKGLPWTKDIRPLCWRPKPVYLDKADEELFAPAYRSLQERYGIRVLSANATQPAT